MAVAKVATFSFNNQVRADYTSYYYRKKLFWALLGRKVMANFSEVPGNIIDIPFFAAMGPAEKPGEDDRLAVDSMGDKSIKAQIYEAAKAWGITDAARYRKGSKDSEWDDEASRQAARVLAEQVDSDALACLNNDGTNSIDGQTANTPAGADEIDKTSDLTLTTAFTAEKGADAAPFIAQKSNVRSLQNAFTSLFGDRASEANVMAMHSNSYNDCVVDTTGGLLKADAVSPVGAIARGYKGNFLGKDTFEIDNISPGPKRTVTDSAGVTQKYQTRKTFVVKPNSFLFLSKQLELWEQARDVLGRVEYHAVTLWYTFFPLHKQNNADDIRAGRIVFQTNEQTT